ncbi:uncharacterized protein LOC119179380 [Rhipicephalus microplus]|uniref:uncharacterized protein LOC119179380 n=1 Tax=Rhipicephalus microplus TaxID=6941 RepID=UPI003F6C3FD0
MHTRFGSRFKRTRRYVAERLGARISVRPRERNRRLGSSSPQPYFPCQPERDVSVYNGPPVDDIDEPCPYWPVFMPLVTPPEAVCFADESIGDVELANPGVLALAVQAVQLDSHSTGPGPAYVVETKPPRCTDEPPRAPAATTVAAMRLRHNSQLMTMLLTDDSRIPGPSLEDWSKSYQVLLTKRTILEERVRAAEQEIRDIRSLHEAKRSQLLKDAEKFRADLLKCGQEEHLRKVAPTMKVHGGVGQSPMPSNCKAAFRVKCVP